MVSWIFSIWFPTSISKNIMENFLEIKLSLQLYSGSWQVEAKIIHQFPCISTIKSFCANSYYASNAKSSITFLWLLQQHDTSNPSYTHERNFQANHARFSAHPHGRKTYTYARYNEPSSREFTGSATTRGINDIDVSRRRLLHCLHLSPSLDRGSRRISGGCNLGGYVTSIARDAPVSWITTREAACALCIYLVAHECFDK